MAYINDLQLLTCSLIQATLAPNTRASYNSAWNHYLQFCRELHLQSTPLVESNLMLFAAHISKTSSYANVKRHLCAIKHFNIFFGLSTQQPTFPRLYLLTRAIRRTERQKHRKPRREPITPRQLHQLRSFLEESCYTMADRQMLWAAFLVAFFGFLRASEFVAPTVKTYDSDSTLLVSDITIPPTANVAHIRIKTSKTDPFRHGCIVRLARTNSTLCPVTALTTLLSSHPTSSGPLFTFRDGSYLTRRRLNRILQLALPSPVASQQRTSSHSFRIGAATTAAAAGYPRWLIQRLGRWNSDCFRIYLQVPDSTISNVAQNMNRTLDTSDDTWDPDYFN